MVAAIRLGKAGQNNELLDCLALIGKLHHGVSRGKTNPNDKLLWEPHVDHQVQSMQGCCLSENACRPSLQDILESEGIVTLLAGPCAFSSKAPLDPDVIEDLVGSAAEETKSRMRAHAEYRPQVQL